MIQIKFAFAFTILFLTNLRVLSSAKQLYLNPNLPAATVFSGEKEPSGASYQDCAKVPSPCIAWPGQSAIITRIEGVPVVAKKVMNPKGILIDREFVKIHYLYEDPTQPNKKKSGDGWIATSTLRETIDKKTEFSGPTIDKSIRPSKKAAAGKCLDIQQSVLAMHSGQQKNIHLLQDVGSATQEKLNIDLVSEDEKLDSLIGDCPLVVPEKKTSLLKKWKGQNIYDVEVLPRLKKAASTLPYVVKQDSSKCHIANKSARVLSMNEQDLINIDALARTIYSEMNGCFDDGIEFPMAAAKVILNRAEKIDRKEGHWKVFAGVNYPQKNKPSLAKATVANFQFSVWNYNSNPNDKTLLMALCPTKHVDHTRNWRGEKASNLEVEIWKQSLRIAKEAVLRSCHFKLKTKNATQLYYTSGMREYDGRKVADSVRIEGRLVKSLSCMYLWEGK